MRPLPRAEPHVAGPGLRLLSVAFRPGPGLLRRGVDVLAVVQELASLGDLETALDASALPAFHDLEVDVACLAWRWRLLTAHDEARVREVFLFVAADSEVSVELALQAVRAPAAGTPIEAAFDTPIDTTIEALLVEVDGQRLLLPLAPVEEIVDLATARAAAGGRFDEQAQGAGGSALLNLRGRPLACVWLHEVFSGAATTVHSAVHFKAHGCIVVVQDGAQPLGLVVDRVLGQRRAAVEPMPPLLRGHALFAGTTILADGDVALFAEPADLVGMAGRPPATRRGVHA